jgi:hypothetical protein
MIGRHELRNLLEAVVEEQTETIEMVISLCILVVKERRDRLENDPRNAMSINAMKHACNAIADDLEIFKSSAREAEEEIAF